MRSECRTVYGRAKLEGGTLEARVYSTRMVLRGDASAVTSAL